VGPDPDGGRLDQIVQGRRIVVCIGSGGVGKTTCAAVLGLHAALSGRKVLVLTIDPAKRLANSLGVAELDNEARRIDLEGFSQGESEGQLWAMMLDMKRSFDRLVDRYAPDEETREKIYDNRLYQYFSTSLAGTQEYSAMERLHELYEEGDFDLIVLDTPPSGHALDFLDAPKRMAEAIESSALQWMYRPSLAARKFGVGLFNIGTTYALRTVAKFTGAEMLRELGSFLSNFRHMFEGFHSRARRVREVLGSNATSFLIVTAPDPLTVDEARFLRERLREEQIPFGGYIVNRVHQPYLPREALETPVSVLAKELGEPESLVEKLVENASEFQVLADLDAHTLISLRERVGSRVIIRSIPYCSRDIHSLEGLEWVRRALFLTPPKAKVDVQPG
jgi:anion-transporting  ArsA/GET3 family ATPase